MATELYGVDARIVDSIGTTPVSTETTIIFIGASPSGTLNNPVLVTSLADYASKLGGVPGDGYNLTDAAIAAFTIANIDKCWMIPVSHSTTFSATDYTGSAENETGVYAIDKLLRENPTVVNILCAPSVVDATVLEALNTVAQKAAGHWQSFIVYDLPQNADQLNSYLVAQVDEIVDDKQLTSERARAVWADVLTAGGYAVSGAAVQACLMSISDANYGVPARCGGNLAINGIQGVGFKAFSETIENTCVLSFSITVDGNLETTYKPMVTLTESGFENFTGTLKVELKIKDVDLITQNVEFSNGVGIVDYDTENLVDPIVETHTVTYTHTQLIVLKEADATQLSADGICSWINYGGGNWHTWGDHTSAFSSGSISDERGRFDNYMRMQMMVANRFQLKYRFSIDDPMTLQMRNDVITEEEDYLNSLVAIGALIGSPKVEFVPADNSVDQVAQGYFTWSISTTEAPPLKYMLAKVAYTQAGLEVFTQEG